MKLPFSLSPAHEWGGLPMARVCKGKDNSHYDLGSKVGNARCSRGGPGMTLFSAGKRYGDEPLIGISHTYNHADSELGWGWHSWLKTYKMDDPLRTRPQRWRRQVRLPYHEDLCLTSRRLGSHVFFR